MNRKIFKFDEENTASKHKHGISHTIKVLTRKILRMTQAKHTTQN